MKIDKIDTEGLFLMDSFYSEDDRGNFTKCFNRKNDNSHLKNFNLAETFYSKNKKNVIRGMHFQTPPYDHEKLVHVMQGSILDVIVDLRTTSPTYGSVYNYELSSKNKKVLFIGKGFAHGFKSLEEDTIVIYQVSTIHNKLYDNGIHYDSINFDWGNDNHLLSSRDLSFDDFEKFKKKNPFK